MTDTTLIVEMDFGNPLLDAEGNNLLDANSENLLDTGFVEITPDIRADAPLSYQRGNSGHGIMDRVANIGHCSFVLDNSEVNSAQTIGYYSPDNGNVRNSFGLDTYVRVSSTAGTVTYPEWQGRISTISPDMGIYGSRATYVTAEDWMADASRDTVKGITVQSNKRDDEILTTILALSARQPVSTDFDTGDDTYTYALHDENSDTSSLIRIFQKLAMSGLGRIYITGYETLTYISRSNLITASSPDATLTDTMKSMTATRDKAQRVRKVTVVTYPSEVDTSNVVLWKSRRELTLANNEEITFDAPLRDPSGRATRVASNSIVTPVAGTDYNFSSVSGSGSDLNSSLTITYTLQADVVTVYMKNVSGTTGYVLAGQQIRGLGLYLYEPVNSVFETGQPDGQELKIDMVYQDDVSVGYDISVLVGNGYVSDITDIGDVTFIANTDDDLLAASFLDVGSLVYISETVTGVGNTYIINGKTKNIYFGGRYVEVTWNLTLANQIGDVFRLNDETFGILDSSTVLGA